MLGVALFIAFWAILGLGTLFIAISGGLKGARSTLQTKSRGGSHLATVALIVVYAGFGLAIPLVLLSGNQANASAQFDTIKLNAADKAGRVLFGQHCAICHTLAAANATGKVGPNLDTLQPTKSLVLTTVLNGRNAGNGTMPQGIVVGKEAANVSDFVSAVAGK